VLDHEGQIFLVTVFLLALLLTLSLGNLTFTKPRLVNYIGELQSAELIHLARFYWEKNNNLSMQELTKIFYHYDKLLKTNIPKYNYTILREFKRGENGFGLYEISFNNTIIFRCRWQWKFQNMYVSFSGREAVIFKNYTLIYYHEYIAPQWGKIKVYPQIYADQPAEIEKRNKFWTIGIPIEKETLSLLDQYGIEIIIKG